MKNGLEMLDKVLKLLLGLKKRKNHADLLATLFLFTSLVSKDKADSSLATRRCQYRPR